MKGKLKKRPLLYIIIQPEIIILLYQGRNNKMWIKQNTGNVAYSMAQSAS
jgi:hypothetical protein